MFSQTNIILLFKNVLDKIIFILGQKTFFLKHRSFYFCKILFCSLNIFLHIANMLYVDFRTY